ncbi:protein vav isoform X2 [Folsomia candida]|uniref:protein vav isoform X2 n=1 Tax=Folsomia candida TaxID=158441 RepID=UPI000B8FA499|nr:protein vav isoform X2 [Folsomia candida]
MCEESWKDCAEWLTRCGLLPPEHRAQTSIKDLAYTLRDGVQLCRLLNCLQSNALDLKEISLKPQMAQFLCLRNIRTFLQTCKNIFDLHDTDLFQPSMLFDLSDFGKVLFTLSKLSNSPKVLQAGFAGFSALPDRAPILDEEMCQNLEDLVSEPPTPLVLPQRHLENEESIYEELCYITFRIKQPPVTLREKRDYVKGELLETEGNYIDALMMLKKKFMKPLSSLMKEEDRKIAFFGIKELSEIHTGFLNDLNRVLTTTSTSNSTAPTAYSYSTGLNKTLGDIFVLWKDKFIIYGDYCANLTRAQSIVEELCTKNELINQEIMRAEKEANEGRFKLRDLLSVPMQRILKYHLLLQKLLDETSMEQHGYDEYKSIERARDAMFDVADFTNEVKRDSETLLIIRQIEGSIYDLKMPDGMELKDYGRSQKDGELRIRGHDDNRLKSRYVFIFDKVLLMCKTTRMMDKLLRGEQYSYKHSLCLQEYRVEDDVPAGTIKKSGTREARWSFCWNLVHIKGYNVYTMYAQTEEQKRRWIKSLEIALTNIQPEECRRTDHMLTMHTFERGATCSQCSKFMKGLFYQGYKCIRCDVNAHRECIINLHSCGTVHPPELPPRPPLLPLMNTNSTDSTITSPTGLTFPETSLPSFRVPSSPSTHSPPLPLNNVNSPSTSNGMRLSIAQPSHHYVNLNHLENYPWYGGEMDRDLATSVLEVQPNGTFLVRVRPTLAGGSIGDATYALSLKWSEQVKHMKILVTPGERLFYLSESRYFKSVVELINWYQHNSLSESFSGLDACLERSFEKPEGPGTPAALRYVLSDSPQHNPVMTRIPGTPS